MTYARGTICVIRSVDGKLEILPLSNQYAYKEFTGCFSLIA